MPFTEDQNMIHTVTLECPDQPLGRRNRAVANPHRPDFNS